MQICLTIVQQMEAFAPRLLTYRGRDYRWDPMSSDHPIILDGEKHEIRVTYSAPKTEDEISHSKVAVYVRYQLGRDTYEIRIVAYDGATCQMEEIAEGDGAHVGDLANIGYMVRTVEKVREGGAE